MVSYSNPTSSAEGARDEAVEASAERLMKFINVDVSNSVKSSTDGDATSSTGGYSSDNEAFVDDFELQATGSDSSSSLSGEEGSSAADSSESNTTKADEESPEEDPDDSSIENEISFLQQKQHLLKRAIDALRREEAYEAFRARDTVNGKFERPTSDLWEEAREIIDLLNDNTETEATTRENAFREEFAPRPVKKARIIDVSLVKHVSAGTLSEEHEVKKPLSPRSLALQENTFSIPSIPFTSSGPWMGQALARTIPALGGAEGDRHSPSSGVRGWEVVNDPDLGLLVVPPSIQPLGYGVELKDALALTSDAQLVTLATPPFCVVHANKAFCNLSGETSSTPFVGKPVETLLQISSKRIVKDDSTTGMMQGNFLLSNNKACQFQVVPVTDKHRNPRGGISHLLVKLHGTIPTAINVESSFVAAATGNASSTNKDVQHNPHLHQVYGTIG